MYRPVLLVWALENYLLKSVPTIFLQSRLQPLLVNVSLCIPTTSSSPNIVTQLLKFLLQEGSPELVEAFLSNNNLNSQQLTMLLLNANMDYIQIYMDTATGTEREEILRVVTEMNNTMLLHGIYKRCYDVDLVS